MPTLTYQTSYGKNNQIVLSITQLVSEFLQGINFVDRNNQPIPPSTFDTHINAAVTYLENFLAIKIKRQYIEEDKEFLRDDWNQWGRVKASYPVFCIQSLEGFVGAVRQVTYQKEWISIKKTNDPIGRHRAIRIVPNQTAFVQNVAVAFSGIYPHLGFLGSKSVPNYWKLKYTTGWDEWDIPEDIKFAIALMASTNLLTFLSTGMNPFFATSNQSISIDGLSQSLTGLQNSNSLLFSPLIKQNLDMLRGPGGKNGMLDNLRSIYGDFAFSVA